LPDEIIKRYIENQTWDDDGGKGFKMVGDVKAASAASSATFSRNKSYRL
jgi:hypothetical protein